VEWKKGLMKELRERSFRTFPDRVPEPSVKGGDVKGPEAVMLLETEPHIAKIGLWIEVDKGKDGPHTLIVLNAGEDAAKVTQSWAKSYVDKGFLYYLYPRGVGDTEWTAKSPPNYVERAHALLGRTVDDGKVWDILAALRAVDDKRSSKWRIVGRDRAGILATYAALLEPSISEVVVVDPPVSHREGPIFLNVLRVLDIPDALGMLAPTPLTLINANDRAFDRTEQIYKAAGAEDKLQRKRSP
jgi:hypothetical protein